jgi:glutamate synthase domain-containing protein 1
MHGYKCNLLTDTEVITYTFDYLHRKLGLSHTEIAETIAAPFWTTIESMPEAEKQRLLYLRNAFSGLLITGPFSIIVGFSGGIMALNDRLKLRNMVIAEKKDTVYIASEESAIRIIEPNVDKIWSPRGGEPIIALLDEKAKGE